MNKYVQSRMVWAVMLLVAGTSFAQITTTKPSERVESSTPKYDSTRNFLGEDVKQYIGQELYLNGIPEMLQGYGYDNFSKIPDASVVDRARNAKIIYNCCSIKSEYNSNYQKMVGKYFEVLDVLERSKSNGREYDLKLQDKSTKDIVYFKYDTKAESIFPFIIVGFFEKLKQQMIGQVFILDRYGDDSMTDLKTGKKINFEAEKEWECIDVTVEEKYYQLSAVLKDDNGQVLAVSYKSFGGEWKRRIFTKTEAESYKKKFGKNFWDLILQSKVKLGMTDEMCRLSWGKPEKINQTINAKSKNEQWVYGDNYLYFTNGVLTTMQ